MDEQALEARLAECERERDEYRAGMLSQGTATAKVEAQLAETRKMLEVQLAVVDKLEAEVKRLADCLKKANAQTEDYERRYYLELQSHEEGIVDERI